MLLTLAIAGGTNLMTLNRIDDANDTVVHRSQVVNVAGELELGFSLVRRFVLGRRAWSRPRHHPDQGRVRRRRRRRAHGVTPRQPRTGDKLQRVVGHDRQQDHARE